MTKMQRFWDRMVEVIGATQDGGVDTLRARLGEHALNDRRPNLTEALSDTLIACVALAKDRDEVAENLQYVASEMSKAFKAVEGS